MGGTLAIIGFIILGVILYYIIRLGVEGGILDALTKYDKLKNKKSIDTEEDETDFKHIKHKL